MCNEASESTRHKPIRLKEECTVGFEHVIPQDCAVFYLGIAVNTILASNRVGHVTVRHWLIARSPTAVSAGPSWNGVLTARGGLTLDDAGAAVLQGELDGDEVVGIVREFGEKGRRLD